MGKVFTQSMPQLHVRVSSTLFERVVAAAKKAEQPITGWVRMAIVEKLQRDGG